MMPAQLIEKLEELLRQPHETEWLEFKEAKNNFDFRELGKYFSALSNEANLKSQPCGWLIFGVSDKDRSICGSHFRPNAADLDSLKHEIARQTTGGITVRDIHVVIYAGRRVVMFEIPPAPPGLPVAFNSHWYGRDGESLTGLSLSELETIRGQVQQADWSAATCPDATLGDLDPTALALARSRFRAKHAARPFADEIEHWTDRGVPGSSQAHDSGSTDSGGATVARSPGINALPQSRCRSNDLEAGG